MCSEKRKYQIDKHENKSAIMEREVLLNFSGDDALSLKSEMSVVSPSKLPPTCLRFFNLLHPSFHQQQLLKSLPASPHLFNSLAAAAETEG